MEYLRGVLNGRKQVFKNDEIRKVCVPRYKELTTEKVLQHCIGQTKILRYLPSFPLNGESPVDREFLFTVVHTVEPDYFPE